jgi:hypothetical protein
MNAPKRTKGWAERLARSPEGIEQVRTFALELQRKRRDQPLTKREEALLKAALLALA